MHEAALDTSAIAPLAKEVDCDPQELLRVAARRRVRFLLPGWAISEVFKSSNTQLTERELRVFAEAEARAPGVVVTGTHFKVLMLTERSGGGAALLVCSPAGRQFGERVVLRELVRDFAQLHAEGRHHVRNEFARLQRDFAERFTRAARHKSLASVDAHLAEVPELVPWLLQRFVGLERAAEALRTPAAHATSICFITLLVLNGIAATLDPSRADVPPWLRVDENDEIDAKIVAASARSRFFITTDTKLASRVGFIRSHGYPAPEPVLVDEFLGDWSHAREAGGRAAEEES